MHTKFMFETVFETENKPVPGDDTPDLVYTEQEYLSAMDQGRMIGMEAGIRCAKEEVDNLASEAMNTLANCLKENQRQQEAVLLDLRGGSARLALAIANKLCGELMQRQPQAEIENLVLACVNQLIAPPTLRLYVNPDVAGVIQSRLGDVIEKAGYTGEIGLAPDPDLPVTDCRIEWDNGGTSFALEDLTNRIADAVQYYCADQYDQTILPNVPDGFFEEEEPQVDPASDALSELNAGDTQDDLEQISNLATADTDDQTVECDTPPEAEYVSEPTEEQCAVQSSSHDAEDPSRQDDDVLTDADGDTFNQELRSDPSMLGDNDGPTAPMAAAAGDD